MVEGESEDLERTCQGVSPGDAVCNYPYTARPAMDGSVTPTLRMSSGILACCRRLGTWAARDRSRSRSAVLPYACGGAPVA
jgi:hypothetical protein